MGWIIFDLAALIFDITFLVINIIQGSLWAILFAVCAAVVLASLVAHIGMYRRGRALKPEEFAHIRALTGCNRDQFAKTYGITVARQKAYENGRRISEDDEAYLLKILHTFERNMK